MKTKFNINLVIDDKIPIKENREVEQKEVNEIFASDEFSPSQKALVLNNTIFNYIEDVESISVELVALKEE